MKWQNQRPIALAATLVSSPGKFPTHLFGNLVDVQSVRLYSSKVDKPGMETESTTSLPHLRPSTDDIHQVSISTKEPTRRTALAVGHARFSNPQTIQLIRHHLLKKGDVLTVARLAGIQAVKDTPRTVVLAHTGVAIEGCHVEVNAVDGQRIDGSHVAQHPNHSLVTDAIEKAKSLEEPIAPHGGVRIAVFVETTGKTGVEMEALAGVSGAALNVVDMVKAVDREIAIHDVKVIGKKGGRSGGWGVWADGRKQLAS